MARKASNMNRRAKAMETRMLEVSNWRDANLNTYDGQIELEGYIAKKLRLRHSSEGSESAFILDDGRWQWKVLKRWLGYPFNLRNCEPLLDQLIKERLEHSLRYISSSKVYRAEVFDADGVTGIAQHKKAALALAVAYLEQKDNRKSYDTSRD
jgi:hypothetical protein